MLTASRYAYTDTADPGHHCLNRHPLNHELIYRDSCATCCCCHLIKSYTYMLTNLAGTVINFLLKQKRMEVIIIAVSITSLFGPAEI